MTYNTPELLLVGAAQNLVLGGSKDPVGPCPPLIDNSTIEYDSPGNWQFLPPVPRSLFLAPPISGAIFAS